MIKSLKIQNFQSHVRSKLEFSTGVNIIVGCSDTGKTAIIRALRFLTWNRPSGNAIRSSFGGKTHVKLYTEEGNILRSKDKQDAYILKIDGQEPIEFKAFGTSVPEEISRFLNINEINLQSQLDAPFLLSDSPGDVAKHFNKIARLDKIDTSIQNINKWIRELEQSIKYKRADLKTKKESLQRYIHLDKFEAEVEVLETMDSEFRKLVKAKSRLIELNESYCDYEEKEKEARKLLKIEKPVLNLLQLYKDKEVLESQRNSLEKALKTINNTNIHLQVAKERHMRLSNKFERLFPDICPLCGKPK